MVSGHAGGRPEAGLLTGPPGPRLPGESARPGRCLHRVRHSRWPFAPRMGLTFAELKGRWQPDKLGHAQYHLWLNAVSSAG
jgi:hypothetical protein